MPDLPSARSAATKPSTTFGRQHAADQSLLDEFVAAFAFNADIDAFDEYGQPLPPPVVCEADARELETLYAFLPGKFPPLYEQLVLSYRWPSLALPMMRLLPNPLGPTIAPIQQDEGLRSVLLKNGYLLFAQAGGGRYDPICFDTRHRHIDGDCPLVRIEHEAILCFGRIGETEIVADSFRALIQDFVRETLDILGVSSTVKRQ